MCGFKKLSAFSHLFILMYQVFHGHTRYLALVWSLNRIPTGMSVCDCFLKLPLGFPQVTLERVKYLGIALPYPILWLDAEKKRRRLGTDGTKSSFRTVL